MEELRAVTESSGKANAVAITAPYAEGQSLAHCSEWRPATRVRRGLRERLLYVGPDTYLLASIALIGLALAFAATGSEYASGGVIFPVTMMLFSCWRIYKYRRCDPALRDLMDLPSLENQFPVEVTYKLQGVRYGVDQGIASFSGGWLHFEGRESEFNVNSLDVASTDVLRRRREAGFTAGFGGTHRSDRYTQWRSVHSGEHTNENRRRIFKVIVDWYVRGRFGQIEIQPYSAFPGEKAGNWRKPVEAFGNWLGTDEPAEGWSLFPPQKVQPEVMARAVRRRRLASLSLPVGGVLAVWVVIETVSNVIGAGVYSPWEVFLALAFVGLLFWNYHYAQRHLRELRRIQEPPL